MAPDADIFPIAGMEYVGFEKNRRMSSERGCQNRTLQMIARALNTGQTIAFIGSGLSQVYGYPSWAQVAEHAAKSALGEIDSQQSNEEDTHHRNDIKSILEGFLSARREEEKRRQGSNCDASSQWDGSRILTILNLCEEVLEFSPQGECQGLRHVIAEQIGDAASKARSRERHDNDPLAHILKRLRIRRFLTTNYDFEIERALFRVKGYSPLDWRPGSEAEHQLLETKLDWKPGSGAEHQLVETKASSLTCDPRHPENLVKFALRAPGFESGVYHLHGTYLRPEKMVITERDYQRAYLQEEPVLRIQREALDLAFAGNPILFIGVGMQEEDLLRPMRQFLSQRQNIQEERPIFALLEGREGLAKRLEDRRNLYFRYGVKVYYYPPDEEAPTTSDGMGRALCNAIDDLAKRWCQWWLGWQKKPPLREPEFARLDPRVLVHHREERNEDRDWMASDTDLMKIKEEIERKRTIVLIGRPGAGKGSLGARLVLDPDTTETEFEKRVFCTTRFTNEILSIVDATADFLRRDGDERKQEGDPVERLDAVFAESAPSDRPNLLVLGGIERLLLSSSDLGSFAGHAGDRGGPMPVGKARNREVQRLLDVLVNSKHTRVILTSTIVPESIANDQASENPKCAVHRLDGVTFEQLRETEGFKELDPRTVRQLHTALRGHAYALSVIRYVLEANKDRDTWTTQLIADLTSVGLHRRALVAVRAVIEHILGAESGPEMSDRKSIAGLLQRIALFTTPVTKQALLASSSDLWKNEEEIETGLKVLLDQNLLIRIAPAPDVEEQRHRFTAHTAVRNLVLHALGNPPEVPGEPHRFDLSSYGAEFGGAVSVSRVGYETVTGCVDRLITELEHSRTNEKPLIEFRDLVRAAFGLTRAHWTATTIGRLESIPLETAMGLRRSHYHSYLRRLFRLLNVIRFRHREELWAHRDVDEADCIRSVNGILYSDEFAWLFNEIGLALFIQGSLLNAHAFLRVGQHVNSVTEHGTNGHRWCYSETNLGLVQMERGRLSRARAHLENAAKVANELGDEDVAMRANGFMGLVEHLSGNQTAATKRYEVLDTMLRVGNQRGASILLRHRGDLRRSQGDEKGAKEDLRQSILAAESGRHFDLLHFARVAEANRCLAAGDSSGQKYLPAALRFARDIGIPKLEADALKVQGHFALAHGEIEEAARLATQCLRIASIMGMHLRVTAGLVFLGRVASARGNLDAATGILKSARALGLRQGYHLQAENAERELMQLA